jgi:hypothetical protein
MSRHDSIIEMQLFSSVRHALDLDPAFQMEWCLAVARHPRARYCQAGCHRRCCVGGFKSFSRPTQLAFQMAT